MSIEQVDSTDSHPKRADLFTPVTDELIDFVEYAVRSAGTARLVCERGNIRLRVLRRLRRGETGVCSMRLLDRVIVGSGVGSLSDWLWFTASDLVKMGIWKEVMRVEGSKRIHRGVEWEVLPKTSRERELISGANRQRRRRQRVRKENAATRKFFRRLLG